MKTVDRLFLSNLNGQDNLTVVFGFTIGYEFQRHSVVLFLS